MLCYAEKMLQFLNQNYNKILKKMPQKLSNDALKNGVNFILLIYWFIIIAGSFIMIS